MTATKAIEYLEQIDNCIGLKYVNGEADAYVPDYLKKAVYIAIQAIQEKLERENPQPLGLDELIKMELLDWVWIEIIDKMEIGKSGYYQKNSDWSEEERFCCGYPGTMYGFRFCDYGKTWLAYRNRPDYVDANKIEGEGDDMVEGE